MYSAKWRNFCMTVNVKPDAYIGSPALVLDFMQQELEHYIKQNTLVTEYKDYTVDRAKADGRLELAFQLKNLLQDFTDNVNIGK